MGTSKIITNKFFLRIAAVWVMVAAVFFSSFPLAEILKISDGRIIDQMYLSRLSGSVIDNFAAHSAEAATASSTLQYMMNIGPVNGSTAIGYNYASFLNPSGSGKTFSVKKIRIKSDAVTTAVYQSLSLRRTTAASGGTSVTAANIPKKNSDSSNSAAEIRYANPTVTYAQATTTEARLMMVVAASTAGVVYSRNYQEFGTDENIVLQAGEGIALMQEAAGDADQRISMYVEWEESTNTPSSQGEYMLNYPRIEIAAGVGYVYHSFFNPVGSGKTAVIKRISIDVDCDTTAVYTNNIDIRRTTAASGGTQISAANIPKKHTGSSASVIEARYSNPTVTFAQASTTEARLLMVTPCAVANQSHAHRNLRFGENDEKLVLQPGEGIAMLSEAAGDVDQLVRMGVEWAEQASTPSAGSEYMMNYPRVELAAAANAKYHTFFNPASSGKTALIKRIGIYVDDDTTAVYQAIGIRRVSTTSAGTLISAANIPKKNTGSGNSAMELRYNNVTATLSGSGVDSRLAGVTAPAAVSQVIAQKEIYFGTREPLVLRPGDGIALYSEAAGDVDQYVKFFVEWEEVASAPAPQNEYLESIGQITGNTTADYVYASFYNPPTSASTTLIKRLAIRVDSAAVATTVPFSIMRISTSSGGTLISASDIPKKNASSTNSNMQVRRTGVTVTYTGSQERLLSVSAPGAVSAVAAPAIGGQAEVVFVNGGASSTQETLVLRPGEGIALRQEGVGYTGHRIFLEIEWAEQDSAPTALGEYLTASPNLTASTASGYVYGALYNPANSGKNYILQRAEIRAHATTTAVYVSATLRRISTSTGGTLMSADNLSAKNSSTATSTAEIRYSGPTVTLSGGTESRLLSVITPGASNQTNGIEEFVIQTDSELVLKPGEGVALYQEAAGDTDQKFIFRFQWYESSLSSGITVSGTVYDTDESANLGSGFGLKLAVGGSTSYNATSTAGGAFAFDSVSGVSDGNILTIWITATTTKATLVLKYGSSCTGYPNCTGLVLVKDQVRMENKHTGSMSESDTSGCNSGTGSACTDSDIGFSNGTQLNVDSSRTLKIVSGTTYAPTIPVVVNGNLQISGTYTPAAATTLYGDWINDGTFNHNNQTVLFSGSSESKIRGSASASFYNFYAYTPGKTLTFKSGQQTSISGSLSLSGIFGGPINIKSDSAGVQWLLNLSGSVSASYLYVKDSGCFSGTIPFSDTISDGGNNGYCWGIIPRGGGGTNDVTRDVVTDPGIQTSGGGDSGVIIPVEVSGGGGQTTGGTSDGGTTAAP